LNERADIYFRIQQITSFPASFWHHFRYFGYSCERMIEIGMGWRLKELIETNKNWIEVCWPWTMEENKLIKIV
jgi:hypothetical protein